MFSDGRLVHLFREVGIRTEKAVSDNPDRADISVLKPFIQSPCLSTQFVVFKPLGTFVDPVLFQYWGTRKLAKGRREIPEYHSRSPAPLWIYWISTGLIDTSPKKRQRLYSLEVSTTIERGILFPLPFRPQALQIHASYDTCGGKKPPVLAMHSAALNLSNSASNPLAKHPLTPCVPFQLPS